MAVLFNAHADRLYNGSLPVNNGSYTVCMWVKPRTGSGQHEFFFESDAAGTTYCLASNNGVLGILNAGGGFVYNVTLGAAMTEDVWYFVAMTINGTTGNLYRGTESTAVTNASGTVATQASSYRVYVGSDGSSSAYPCFADIAHVRIWNAILTESELNAERQSATAVRTANISAEWRMVDAAGKLTDSSGQSHPLVASSTGPWADATDPSFGPEPVTGTVAVTLGGTTSAGVGLLVPVGSAAATLGATTSTSEGAHGVAGSAAATLGATTSTSEGAHGVAGSAAATLGETTPTSEGAHGVAGSAAATLGSTTSTSEGAHGVSGSAAAALGATTSTSEGAHGVSGSAAAALGSTTCAGVGEYGSGTVTGTIAYTLGATTLAGTGAHGVAGTVATTLGVLTCAGVGLLVPVGSVAASLGATLCAGAGAHGIVTTGAVASTLTPARCWAAGYFGTLPVRYVPPEEVSEVTVGASIEATVTAMSVTLEVA